MQSREFIAVSSILVILVGIVNGCVRPPFSSAPRKVSTEYRILLSDYADEEGRFVGGIVERTLRLQNPFPGDAKLSLTATSCHCLKVAADGVELEAGHFVMLEKEQPVDLAITTLLPVLVGKVLHSVRLTFEEKQSGNTQDVIARLILDIMPDVIVEPKLLEVDRSVQGSNNRNESPITFVVSRQYRAKERVSMPPPQLSDDSISVVFGHPVTTRIHPELWRCSWSACLSLPADFPVGIHPFRITWETYQSIPAATSDWHLRVVDPDQLLAPSCIDLGVAYGDVNPARRFRVATSSESETFSVASIDCSNPDFQITSLSTGSRDAHWFELQFLSTDPGDSRGTITIDTDFRKSHRKLIEVRATRRHDKGGAG